MVLDQKAKDIRKQWFYFTIGYFLVYPVLLYAFVAKILSADYTITSPSIADVVSSKNEVTTLISFLLEMMIEAIIVLCLLHYAYKKQGIKLLTFVSFAGLLGLPLALIGLVNNYNPVNLGLFILECLMYLYWLYLSMKLRKVNKKICKQNL